jgi:hypothetical protein
MAVSRICEVKTTLVLLGPETMYGNISYACKIVVSVCVFLSIVKERHSGCLKSV